MLLPSDGFLGWLQTGHGIYWINGTVGSGKSTVRAATLPKGQDALS